MSINEIESQIQSLKDIAISIFKFYAEKERFPPSIIDELAQDAMDIFLELYRQRKHIGKSFESLAQSSILLAARKRGIPIGNYKAVLNMLKNLHQNIPLSPLPCIEWLCHNLGLSKATEEKAKEIANVFRTKKPYRSHSPRVLAASSVYVACLITGERKTQKEIADIARCTEVAIRNVYHDIIKTLKISLQSPNNIYTEEIDLPINSGISSSKPDNPNTSRSSKDILTFIKSKVPEFEYLNLTQQIIEIHKLFPRLKPNAISEILGTTRTAVRTILYKYRKGLIKPK